MSFSISPDASIVSADDLVQNSTSAAGQPTYDELVGPGASFTQRNTREIELIKAAYAAAAGHIKPAVHPSVVALAFASMGAPVAENTSLNAISRVVELYIRKVRSL